MAPDDLEKVPTQLLGGVSHTHHRAVRAELDSVRADLRRSAESLRRANAELTAERGKVAALRRADAQREARLSVDSAEVEQLAGRAAAAMRSLADELAGRVTIDDDGLCEIVAAVAEPLAACDVELFGQPLTDQPTPHGTRTYTSPAAPNQLSDPIVGISAWTLDVHMTMRFHRPEEVTASTASTLSAVLAAVTATRSADMYSGREDQPGPSVLAGPQAYYRFKATAAARGNDLAEFNVTLQGDEWAETDRTFGRAAFSADVFAVAIAVDGVAREYGGQAFAFDEDGPPPRFVLAVARAGDDLISDCQAALGDDAARVRISRA